MLRCPLDGEPAFTEAVRRVRDVTRAALAHQETPFERLVDELAPERDLSRTPLFQVAFDLHDEESTSTVTDPVDMDSFLSGWRIAKTDLSLYLKREPDGSFTGALEYASALFDHSTVERMADHLSRLLRALAVDPEQKVSEVDFLDPGERAWALAPPVATADEVRCLHHVFEERVRATPDATAVVAGDVRLSYRELNERANRLAHHLVSLGAGPESLVGVCLDRGPDLVPALLGVLKAGAAYLPLDPAQPADRTAYLIEDGGAKLVVTSSAQLAKVAHGGATTVVLDDQGVRAALATASVDDPVTPVGPDDPIYVIYTSGSTGRPKGVCVTHANVHRLFDDARRRCSASTRPTSGRCSTRTPSISRSGSCGVPCCTAARSSSCRPRCAASPDEFARPAGGRAASPCSTRRRPRSGRLSRWPPTGDPRMADLALRTVRLRRREARTRPTWRRLGGRLRPGAATTWSTCTGSPRPPCTSPTTGSTADRRSPRPGSPIGVAAAGPEPPAARRARAAGADRRTGRDPRRRGRRGPGLPEPARADRPAVHAGPVRRPAGRPPVPQRRPRPPPAGRRWTSWAAPTTRSRSAATGWSWGRSTAALAAQPGVREAVAVLSGDRLVGYLVPAEGATAPGAAELRTVLAEALPEYMIPAAFVALPKIPLTVNGKLDKRALPAPDRDATGAGEEYTAPSNPVEERIAAGWAELLGNTAGTPGVHDNFFVHGGDSIRAVRLASWLQAEFGVEVKVRTVFERPTIAQLAVAVEELIRAEVAALTDEELLVLGEQQ